MEDGIELRLRKHNSKWWNTSTKPSAMIGFLNAINFPESLLPSWVQEKDYPKNEEQCILACHQIREYIGDPFINVAECSSKLINGKFVIPWRSERVLSFARGIMQSGKFEDILVLSDLLEETGCTNQQVIKHFRQKILCTECDGIGGFEIDTGDWIHCKNCNKGWIPKPVPCDSNCWLLRLLLGN